MKNSYTLRLPYTDGQTSDRFTLNKQDVEYLKRLAKANGQSLRMYLTFKLTKITRLPQ